MRRLLLALSVVLTATAVTAGGAAAATKAPAKKPAATKKVVKKASKKKPAAKKKALVKPLTAVDGKMTAPGAFRIMSGVACGRIGGIWRPGTVTKLGRFQTFTLQASTAKKLAAQTKGAKRKAWQKKAARFLAQDTLGRAICQQTASYGPYPTYPNSGGPSYAGYVPPVQAPVRFDLSGAVGVASGTGLTGAATTRSGHTLRSAISSNLAVVDRAGHLRDAVTTGNVTVGQFLIAPSNKLYVLFNGRTLLNGGGTTSENPCLLAVIDRATGIPTCVDDSLSSINWNTGQGNGNPAIQFDDSGAVYYMGYTTDGHMVLRRSSNGIRRDLVTDYASASDFVVLGDGTVVLSGSTYATGAQWLRRISPQDSLQTLKTAQSSFLRKFPDGNVYFGASSNVLRYLPSTDALDPAPWIGYPTGSYYYPEPDPTAPHNDVSTLCGYYSGQDNSAFCNSNGASVMKTFTTGDGKVFVINGWGPNGQLMQYYPSVVRPTTEVTKVSVAQGGSSSLVLSGLNAQDKNVTTLFDTTDGSERELIGPDPELEVYHVNYLPDSTTVMFDGLRFSDNSYILGTVDLTTGTVTASTPLAGKLTAFETFR
jgi:hypothetical protein